MCVCVTSASATNVCTVVVTGKVVNHGDKEGMQVPCNLCLVSLVSGPLTLFPRTFKLPCHVL